MIVILVPMDYDNIATAPAWTAEGSIGHGYVIMAQIANQMAKFMRGTGLPRRRRRQRPRQQRGLCDRGRAW